MNVNDDVEMRDGQADLDDEWICIKSGDGFTYLVKGSVATVSGTLKNTLTSDLRESQTKTCELNERAAVVEKLLEYLTYKSIYEKSNGKEEIPDFMERIAPEVALELLMAADYYEA